MNIEDKKALRLRRKHRVSRKIFGTELRPRLSVHRSLKHMYAQIINDDEGKTLVFVSSTKSGFIEDSMKKTDVAKKIGTLIAEQAIDKGIKKVVFDRGGFLYHGRIKALAESAREAGLEF
ncbi:MAG: 50S ribosomal protein L18 [Nitrospirota bacterium]